MNLDTARAIGATPAGLRFIDELKEQAEQAQQALMICSVDDFKKLQGEAAVYAKLLNLFAKAAKPLE